jgi:hypothetical protein
VVLMLGPQFNALGAPEGHNGGVRLPAAPELAMRLADRFGVADDVNDLAWVSQHVDAVEGRGPLCEAMQTAIAQGDAPNAVHCTLARISAALWRRRNLGQLIITTNYDAALETAFDALHVPYDLAVLVTRENLPGRFLHIPWEAHPRAYETIEDANGYTGFPMEITRLRRTVIVKLQGGAMVGGLAGAPEENYVVTEDDHLGYATAASISDLVPVQILGKMQQSGFLFLGCPLRNWTVRLFLQRVWATRKRSVRSAAAAPSFDRAERNLWEQLKVDVIRDELTHFAGGLEHMVLTALEGDAP